VVELVTVIIDVGSETISRVHHKEITAISLSYVQCTTLNDLKTINSIEKKKQVISYWRSNSDLCQSGYK